MEFDSAGTALMAIMGVEYDSPRQGTESLSYLPAKFIEHLELSIN